jgi:hypothetical protein
MLQAQTGTSKGGRVMPFSKGYTKVPNSMIRSCALDAKCKAILMCIHSRGIQSFPTIKTISEETGISMSTTKIKISAMKTAGVIKITVINRRNHYSINWGAATRKQLRTGPSEGPESDGHRPESGPTRGCFLAPIKNHKDPILRHKEKPEAKTDELGHRFGSDRKFDGNDPSNMSGFGDALREYEKQREANRNSK